MIFIAAVLALLFVPALAAPILSPEEAAAIMPDVVGDFRAGSAVRPFNLNLTVKGTPEALTKVASAERFDLKLIAKAISEDSNAFAAAYRAYTSDNGEAFILTLVRTRSEAAAYALLTQYAAEMSSRGQAQLTKTDGVGTAGFATPERIIFFKGPALVSITGHSAREGQEQLIDFARSFAETLTSEENDIPALVKHLPDWETMQEHAVFTVSLHALQEAAGNRPALEAIDFAGGTEAVTAAYGAARLVIIEFGTPQISVDNDARITARLKELNDAGQPVPSAYRRVGNYSVFVFDAPDETAAGQLIDRITYEKVVQWLGNNPRAFERAMKEYNETTSGLIIGVIKASGGAALLCLAVGSLFGALIFMRRRAQQAATDKYSDAGGMLRLNIDELTPQIDPSRLLEKGDS